MITFLFVVFLILFAIAVVVAIMRSSHVVYVDPYDDEEVTTTTVTTTVVSEPVVTPAPTFETVGELKRKKARNGQFYVMDPVDNDKMFLNATDDLYEDGAGKLWKLV